MQFTQLLAFVASTCSLVSSLPAAPIVSRSPYERPALTTNSSTTTGFAGQPIFTPNAEIIATTSHPRYPVIVTNAEIISTTTGLARMPKFTANAEAPVPPTSDDDLGVASQGSCVPIGKQSYGGPAFNFPRQAEWRSFDELFNCNTAQMRATGDTEQDINNIRTAILQVAGNTGVDARVILAIIMQESHGKVNVPNAWDGQNTPGLMQAQGCPNHAGEAVVSPEAVIEMVQCGTNHFKNIDGGASSDENKVYIALRSFNSGVNGVNRGDLSNSGSGTNSYVSDIANRLKGWSG